MEAAAFAGLALLVAAVVFGPAVADASFHNDSWMMLYAERTLPSYGAVVDAFAWMQFRPVGRLYWPGTFALLGTDPGVHAGWTVLVGVGTATALFAFLRELRLPAYAAVACGLLALLVPIGDAARLWAGASSNTLAIGLWLVGTTMGLRALAATGGRRTALHVASVAVLVTGAFLYEVMALPMVLSALLYRVRAPTRTALRRGAVDAVVGLTALVWSVTRSVYDTAPTGDLVDRVRPFVGKVARLVVDAAFPFAEVPTAVGSLLLAAAVGFAATVALGRREAGAWAHLQRWTALAAGALVVMACGWALVLPSPFDPLGTGQLNRVNNLPGLATAVFLVAVAGLAGTAAGALRGRPAAGGQLAVAVVAPLLAVGWAVQLREDASDWRRAAAEQQRVLDAVDRVLPPRPGPVTVFTAGHAIEGAPGIPVFAAPWDLSGALADRFSPQVRGFVVLPGTTFECGPRDMRARNDNDVWADPEIPRYPGTVPIEGQRAVYGRAVLVDVAGGRATRIASQAACRAEAGTYAAGPMVLPAA